MKRTKQLLSFAIALLFISNAYAEDFEEKKELNRKSKNFEMKEKVVPLLEMQPGLGNSVVLSKILKKFDSQNEEVGAIDTDLSVTDEDSYSSDNDERCLVTNNGWHVTVSGNGTRVAYLNDLAFAQIKKRPEVIDMGKIGKKRLKKIGRKFIEEQLAEFIDMKQGEKLVPLHSLYEIDIDYDVNSDIEQETVTGNIAIFSRSINGIDVIGPGSKISIMFANDETPVAFRYDWPEYQVSDFEQTVIDLGQLNSRKSALSIMNENATDVEMERFECGYYDPGYYIRDDDFVAQTACAAFYKGKVGKGQTNVMDMIPIGQLNDIVFDPNWDAAMALLGEGEYNAETDVTDTALEVDIDHPDIVVE